MPDSNATANTISAEVVHLVSWYKSKALYIGAVVGLILGLVVNHWPRQNDSARDCTNHTTGDHGT